MQETTEKARGPKGLRNIPQVLESAMLLHVAGWSNTAIGKSIGCSGSNIAVMLQKISGKMNVPGTSKVFKYAPIHYTLDPEVFKEVVSLRQQGWSIAKIARKVGRTPTNVVRMLKKVSVTVVNQDMKTNPTTAPTVGATQKRVSNAEAASIPTKETVNNEETQPGPTELDESPEQTIARLKREMKKLECQLRDARIERDIYNEIIDIAETRYNIPIRKKAGAKQ